MMNRVRLGIAKKERQNPIVVRGVIADKEEIEAEAKVIAADAAEGTVTVAGEEETGDLAVRAEEADPNMAADPVLSHPFKRSSVAETKSWCR